MSKYNFDRVIDRVGTDCVNGILELIVQQKHKRWFAFWIADMDFECAEPIIEALRKKLNIKYLDIVQMIVINTLMQFVIGIKGDLTGK